MKPKTRSAPPRAMAMLESLRGLGYSTGAALADIIDNSVSAGATEVRLDFAWDGKRSRVAVLDNGRGMDDAELESAMRLGDKNPLDSRSAHDLGRFGMGLKTASFSQCRRLTVATIKGGATSCLRWDLDELAADPDGGWLLFEGPAQGSKPFIAGLKGKKAGTLVLWESMDRIVTDGYRPGYLDLCRLYTSPDLVKWFGHIADASEELREEFDFMAKAKLTPEQYGLKVMSHETLTVTSPLKMRNAQTLSLTYSGTRPQTILFHRKAAVQRANLDATDALVAALGTKFVDAPKYPRDGEADSWPGARLWQDVDAPHVLAFLAAYATHPNATSAKAAVLSDFITKMLDIGKLTKWSVALLSGGDGVGEPHAFPGGFEPNSLQTRKTDDPDPPGVKDPSMFAIGVLTDPKDEGIDIDDDVWRDALARTRAAWKPDPARGRVNPPTSPSGKGIREARDRLGGDADRGLLLLYTLSPYKGKAKVPENLIVPGWDKPIMAFAIAFPSAENGIRVEYEVNLLYWMQEYGPSE